VGFERGVRAPLISPDEAAAQTYDAADQARIDALRARAFAGTADAVAERLDAEARRLGLDELVLVTWTFDPAAREHSYALLARAFDLPAE
jgi:alkanesulfonate monooxygenase SsuD/methylene tetrahydromethanopterin reductase-like flavin-dependent oxidoreductase (luciferase family)